MVRADWLSVLVLSILWGGSFFLVEVALGGLPVMTIVWARVALAAVVLGVVLRAMAQPFPGVSVWPALAVMGILNNVVPFTLFVTAQGQISGALASVLNATTPLFTLVVAHLATRDERISGAKGAGLGFGFAGVVVMLAGEGLDGEAVAMLACLMAALSYGLAGVWGRRFRAQGLAPLPTAFGQVTASALVLLPVWLWRDAPWAMGWPGLWPTGAVVALAVFSTALAYVLFFRVLARAGATNLSLVTFLVPVSATAMGWAILGERLYPQHLMGFGLILVGLMAIDGRIWRRLTA